ncbi:MAG: hypothetical protein IV088_24015 [Hydrogenophaga sp.]|nr:hypothetical protein [Hydrogenophaga sp.]
MRLRTLNFDLSLKPMQIRLSLAVFLAVAAAGCANESGARLGLTSAKSPVLAILADDLFTGEAVGYMDRTGTIDIASVVDPNLKCVGQFRYTGSKAGVATVRCNDGGVGELSFNGLSLLSGYGYGTTSRGPASFTFGLTPEQALKYLTLPKGKQLIKREKGPVLESV